MWGGGGALVISVFPYFIEGCTPGGGGTLIFSAYVGSDPASALHPKKISGISSTPKKYLKFKQPKKISPILYLDLKKRP